MVGNDVELSVEERREIAERSFIRFCEREGITPEEAAEATNRFRSTKEDWERLIKKLERDPLGFAHLSGDPDGRKSMSNRELIELFRKEIKLLDVEDELQHIVWSKY